MIFGIFVFLHLENDNDLATSIEHTFSMKESLRCFKIQHKSNFNTCSGFFLVLTSSSLFGIVPPSQPMLIMLRLWQKHNRIHEQYWSPTEFNRWPSMTTNYSYTTVKLCIYAALPCLPNFHFYRKFQIPRFSLNHVAKFIFLLPTFYYYFCIFLQFLK